jgi:heme exporter protein CcmD
MIALMESLLGPHAEFIALSYAAVIILVGGLAVAIVTDHRRQTRLIAERDPRARDKTSTSGSSS